MSDEEPTNIDSDQEFPFEDAIDAHRHATGVYVDGEPRDRGIFTHADREQIIQLREFDSPQQRSNVRGRQVQRVLDALHDIPMLVWLDDLTKERIYDSLDSTFYHRVMRDITQFLYQGSERDTEMVESAVGAGVGDVEFSQGDWNLLRSVDVDITIDLAPDPDVAMELVEAGEYNRLTLEQIGVLVREGLLDEEDYEHLNWMGRPSDAPASPEPIDEEEEETNTTDES